MDRAIRDQDNEMLSFTKYSVLAPELRNHALTYLDSKTMWNYSQCSNYCNLEVKKFNIKAPTVLIIRERYDGIIVELSYSKVYEDPETDPNWVEKFFPISTSEEKVEKAEQYFSSLYQYVKEGKTRNLSVNLQQWSFNFMKLKNVTEIENLTVFVQSSTFDDFFEFSNTNKTRVKSLTLIEVEIGSIQKEEAKQLFKSEFFQQMSKVYIDWSCEIDDNDFLGFTCPNIFLRLKNRHISDDAIHQKVAQINSRFGDAHISVIISEDCIDKFDLGSMFPEVDPIEHGTVRQYKIGDVDISTDGEDGKYLCINKLDFGFFYGIDFDNVDLEDLLLIDDFLDFDIE